MATKLSNIAIAAMVAALGLQLAVPPPAAGQRCAADADCGKYAACINGTCCKPSDFANRCGGTCGVTCPDASICGGSKDCQSGSVLRPPLLWRRV